MPNSPASGSAGSVPQTPTQATAMTPTLAHPSAPTHHLSPTHLTPTLLTPTVRVSAPPTSSLTSYFPLAARFPPPPPPPLPQMPDFPAVALKRKERDDEVRDAIGSGLGGSGGGMSQSPADEGSSGGTQRRNKGKQVLITPEMLSAGVNDPPCERCRDTHRSCVRGPHAACLTCVAGKTACSLVPPKSSTNPNRGGKDRDRDRDRADKESGGGGGGGGGEPARRRARPSASGIVQAASGQLPLPAPVHVPSQSPQFNDAPPSGMPMPPPYVPTWPTSYGHPHAPHQHQHPQAAAAQQHPHANAMLDPNQTLVTRAELLAAEARIEARVRAIVREEIAALRGAGGGGSGSGGAGAGGNGSARTESPPPPSR